LNPPPRMLRRVFYFYVIPVFPMPIRLIAGLGNPGPDYESTRHNAGFWLLERLARAHGAHFNLEKGFKGQVAKVSIGGQAAWLVMPQTFMNRSGQSVGALATFYKIAPQEVLVVHDELDLPPGVVKMKLGGGHGGHNGLKDIEAHLGTRDFWRLRVGIGHPRELGMAQEVVDFVLHRASSEHQTVIDDSITKALAVLPQAVAGDMEAAMQTLHSTKPPRPHKKDLPKDVAGNAHEKGVSKAVPENAHGTGVSEGMPENAQSKGLSKVSGASAEKSVAAEEPLNAMQAALRKARP
jgi:peptidyl-tRNA hydrolase, PTH1 family